MKGSEILKIHDQVTSLEASDELRPVMSAVSSLAVAADRIQSKLVCGRPWAYKESGESNQSGDKQTEQDKFSQKLFLEALRQCPSVGSVVSEESEGLVSTGTGLLSVSLDPFDGSTAFEFGIPPGTIFGIFEAGQVPSHFVGRKLLAAGVFIYRHNLELVLSTRNTTWLIDGAGAHPLTEIPSRRTLVCANLSNMSKWGEGWQSYFNSRILKSSAGNEHNMRWYGSLATHFGAVIRSGGLFAYPPDNREGYAQGHLRLIYEAAPISFIIECLKGRATNGIDPILDLVPKHFHQKTPFVFGEAAMVLELEESIRASLRE